MRGQAAAAVVAVLVAVGLLAAGCGGKPSALEQWQDSVCSSMNDYVEQMAGYANDIRSQLSSPHTGMAAEIEATLKQGEAATNGLRTQLKELGAPPVENGDAAQQLVGGLSADLQQSAARIQHEAGTLAAAGSVTEVATSISTIASEVARDVERTKSTFSSLKSLSTDLKDGFDNIDSCKKLQKSFGG
jgi:uncharacterized protein YhaN